MGKQCLFLNCKTNKRNHVFIENFFWILPLLVFIFPVLATHKLHERFKWSVIEYAFVSEVEKNEALATGRYIPTNNLPLGIEVWKDKLFVTVPRWRSGRYKQKFILVFSF